MGWASRALIGWDTFALVSLVLIGVSLLGCGPDALRWRAQLEDEGRFVILGLLLIAALASTVAIGFAIRPVDGLQGWNLALYIVETAGTIILSWFLMQTLFALHYARDWYTHERNQKKHPSKKTPPPLAFAGDELPEFTDFLYFSFTIGMTFQTSDTEVNTRSMRRLVLVHGVVAFFYNTGIVALSINIVAGLLH